MKLPFRWIFLTTLVLTGLSLMAEGGERDRQNLKNARQTYRQAVQLHGQGSREALEAKNRLRETRRAYHAAIRQQRTAQPPRPAHRHG